MLYITNKVYGSLAPGPTVPMERQGREGIEIRNFWNPIAGPNVCVFFVFSGKMFVSLRCTCSRHSSRQLCSSLAPAAMPSEKVLTIPFFVSSWWWWWQPPPRPPPPSLASPSLAFCILPAELAFPYETEFPVQAIQKQTLGVSLNKQPVSFFHFFFALHVVCVFFSIFCSVLFSSFRYSNVRVRPSVWVVFVPRRVLKPRLPRFNPPPPRLPPTPFPCLESCLYGVCFARVVVSLKCRSVPTNNAGTIPDTRTIGYT